MNEIEKTPEYFAWIGELKKRYRSTQIKASVSVNSALLEFYWLLGKDIGERYPASKLGNQFYKILSADLKMDIPNASGLSPSSLKYSGYFYRLYSKLWLGQQVADLHIEPSQQPADSDNLPKSVNPSVSISQTRALPIADLLVRVPWGHHMLIIDKCGGDVGKALFYVRKTVENGWSRNVLAVEIASDLYSRQGKAVTNFEWTLPEPDSDLAQQLTKDLLFYCIPLHRYFAVEVKTGEFEPSYLGQLQGYVAACDMMLNTPQENPAIGLLVCRGKNAPLAKYLLGKIDMPIGVSDYELLRKVPDDFKSQLPTIEEIEAELANMEKEDGK